MVDLTYRIAPAVGLEPTTVRLTVECSAIELRGIATGNTLSEEPPATQIEKRQWRAYSPSGHDQSEIPVTSRKDASRLFTASSSASEEYPSMITCVNKVSPLPRRTIPRALAPDGRTSCS